MPRIILATKCDHLALDKFLGIARKFGLVALEVHETFRVMQSADPRERAAIVASKARNVISRIAFHQPLWSAVRTWEQAVEAAKHDIASFENSLAVEHAKDVIREAVEVGTLLGLEEPVPVNFHAIGFVRRPEISLRRKLAQLEHAERTLITIKSFADELCKDLGFVKNGVPLLRVVRENNYPYQAKGVYSILDASPYELTRLKGIGVNLDFAHLQLSINYFKARPRSARAIVERRLNPPPSWEGIGDIVGGSLALVHLNDAKGHTSKNEGIVIGLGEVPFSSAVPDICTKLGEDVVGTIEIKDQHVHPEKFVESLAQLKRIFGRSFHDYFYIEY